MEQGQLIWPLYEARSKGITFSFGFLFCFTLAALTTLAKTATPKTSKTLDNETSEWEGLLSAISKFFQGGCRSSSHTQLVPSYLLTLLQEPPSTQICSQHRAGGSAQQPTKAMLERWSFRADAMRQADLCVPRLY